MGREIAYAAIVAGYRAILEDVSSETLGQGFADINRRLEESVVRGQLTLQERDAVLARLSSANRVDEVCRTADLLLETVPEEMEVKLEIFTIFDKFAKPDAILASNTWLSITDIASITFRTENCVGMRFLGGEPKLQKLEIVRGAETSDATVATCIGVGNRMGKQVAVVRESAELVAGCKSDAVSRAKGCAE